MRLAPLSQGIFFVVSGLWPVRTLGIASAVTLATADLAFAGKGRISPVYFADAAIEAGVVATWLVTT